MDKRKLVTTQIRCARLLNGITLPDILRRNLIREKLCTVRNNGVLILLEGTYRNDAGIYTVRYDDEVQM